MTGMTATAQLFKNYQDRRAVGNMNIEEHETMRLYISPTPRTISTLPLRV